MQSVKYSIVIPTYNNCEKYLKPCIDSIIKYSDMQEVELIVSANGCTDNTSAYLDYLATVIPNLVVVWDEKPLGYAKATNKGVEAASADKIILLNNDTVLLEQDKNYWLKLLDAPFAKNDKCGISCIIKQFSPDADCDFAVFFCVMVHRKVFDSIGLLNEDYGVGAGEDTEFCIMAERAGFEVCEVLNKYWGKDLYTGGFPIYHKGEGTVHDPSLVENWSEIYRSNSLKLAYKFGDKEAKDSLAWLCDNGAEATELYDEVIKENIYRVSSYLLTGREVIDVGANMGTFALFASRLGASKVIAVEPITKTLNIFKDNVRKAGADNIVLKQNIVSDTSGNVVKISLHEKSGHNSVYSKSEVFEEIDTISLKDLVSMTESNDIFLKMDCEGGEYDILLNADPEDMRRISRIAIEIHGDLHPKFKDIGLIHTALSNFGYTPVSQKRIYGWDLDAYGNRINVKELPLTQELWSR